MAQSEQYPPEFLKTLGVSQDLISIAEGDYGCPHLIYCVWKSGRHAVMRLTCKSWKCADCSKVKILKMTQDFADATTGLVNVHEVLASMNQRETIMKYYNRRKIPALSIKFRNSFYVVGPTEACGKDWESEPIGRFDAIIKVHSVDRLLIQRRDFTLDWKPESTYEPKKDTVVLSRKFKDITEARSTLAQFGQDINSELVNGDPLELMESMLQSESAYTIDFGS